MKRYKMKKWSISFLVASLAALLLFIPVNKLHLEQNEQLYEEQHTAASEHLSRVRNEVKARLDSSFILCRFF